MVGRPPLAFLNVDLDVFAKERGRRSIEEGIDFKKVIPKLLNDVAASSTIKKNFLDADGPSVKFFLFVLFTLTF